MVPASRALFPTAQLTSTQPEEWLDYAAMDGAKVALSGRTPKEIARHDLDGYTLSEHQAVQTRNLSKVWSTDAKDVASLLNSDGSRSP